MGVAKARHIRPLPEQTVPVTRKAVVIGGGIAGMTAAFTLADQGFQCFLIEKNERAGRPAPQAALHPRRGIAGGALERSARRSLANKLIHVLTDASWSRSGYIGNFRPRFRRRARKAGDPGPRGDHHRHRRGASPAQPVPLGQSELMITQRTWSRDWPMAR